MRSSQAALLCAALWLLPSTRSWAEEASPRLAAHPAKRKAVAKTKITPMDPAATAEPVVTPMFGDEDRPATPAERAASLERRRKAFFADKPVDPSPDSDAAPAGVTLGGANGLTPGMGMKF